VAAAAFGAVAPGSRPSPHRTAIDAPAITILVNATSRSAGRARRMGTCASGAEDHRRGERRYPDGSNAGDEVKARGRDPGRPPRGEHRQEAAAFKQGKDVPQLARRMTFAARLRASPVSCERDGSGHRLREHRRRCDPCGTLIAAPRHRRVGIRPTARVLPRGQRTRHRNALNSAAVFATAMSDESRLIVPADSSITARC